MPTKGNNNHNKYIAPLSVSCKRLTTMDIVGTISAKNTIRATIWKTKPNIDKHQVPTNRTITKENGIQKSLRLQTPTKSNVYKK